MPLQPTGRPASAPFRLIPALVARLAALALLAPAALAQTPLPAFPVTDGAVLATAVAADGTLYIGGTFVNVGPYTGTGARLTSDTGTVQAGGLPVDDTIYASVPDGAGGTYIGGDFTTVGGQARTGLAHIRADGALDPAFNPSANGTVRALALSGGTLYVGGSFTSIGGQTRNNIAALDATTGTALTGFDPNASGVVSTLTLSGATLYAGGSFARVGGTPRGGLAAFSTTPVASEGTAAAAGALGVAVPNPASGHAALALTLDAPQHVRAVVIDALGREVLTVLDADVVGVVRLDVPAARPAPGVYTVRVVGATFAAARRLTVVR